MSVTGFQAAVATLVSHALGLRSSSKPDAKSRQHSLSRGSATRRARTCAEEELLVVAKGVAVGDAHEAVDDDDQPVLAGHPHSLALAVRAGGRAYRKPARGTTKDVCRAPEGIGLGLGLQVLV
jgi:hypothetical protein